jgi:AraC-like DNA-binding protein
MKIQSQRTPFFLGAAAALMLTFSTAAVFPQVAQTGDATPTPGAQTPAKPDNDANDTSPDKGTSRFGVRGRSAELLAEALGITTDELNAAYLEAANAALDQAVAEDLLTQTQADNLRERLEAASGNGFPFHLGGRGFALFGSETIDSEALLAKALGISTDELQAAFDDAEAAALTQAVEEGQLTQEQADLVAARRALQEYWATQQHTYAEIVQGALDAGAITQEQADLLLENEQSLGGRGFGMHGEFGRGMMPGIDGRGMRGGHERGRGMPGGNNGSEDAQPDDGDAQSNSSFVLPNAGL